ncbi:MAG: hypothetical protein DI537_05355 [Stutzerimonas stutzeri]|nr:MAG: hypothetical protein DI537_05355 [Stutzerimonas stutzeri]
MNSAGFMSSPGAPSRVNERLGDRGLEESGALGAVVGDCFMRSSTQLVPFNSSEVELPAAVNVAVP